MKKKKFLTVYIIFDEQTEISLQHIQNEILNRYPYGTQTMGIPFHISLGSFPLEAKEELEKMIKEISLISRCYLLNLRLMKRLFGFTHYLKEIIRMGIRGIPMSHSTVVQQKKLELFKRSSNQR